MDVSKYKNTLPYPTKPKSVASLGIPDFLKDTAEAKAAVADLEAKHTEYQKALAAYRQEDGRLGDLFRKDALEEVGLTGHPRADKAFGLAYSKGHSGGLAEVVCELREIAEVLQD